MIELPNTLDTIIAKAKENLSDETKAAIDAVSWRLILSGINKKYTPDQMDSLELETELLLYGLVTPEEYPKELEGRMRLHKAEVATLINEIDKLIFKKISEELEKRLEQRKDAPVKKEIVLDPRFTNLPIETQRAISLSDWKENVFEIAKKYKLNIEQTGELENITIKTLSNVIHTDQYENEIKSKFNLGDDKNKEMVMELNLKVFTNIKELMKNSSGKAWKIPTPPYIKKRITVVPLPPSKIINNDQLLINNEKNQIEKGFSNQIDPYKEHGIEIINNDQLLITNEPTKEETPEAKNEEIIKEVEQKPLVNIMMDKLLNKTSSNISVHNYSIPKMSTPTPGTSQTINTAPENPHDAYHESI